MIDKTRILFLCTGNSCCSQMAEGWAKHLGGESTAVYSAGIERHRHDPKAVKVMAEAGVDISKNRSKPINELLIKEFDLVVTLCDHAGKTCPFFPGAAKRVHRRFDDQPRLAEYAKPEDEALMHYRRVRDEIRRDL